MINSLPHRAITIDFGRSLDLADLARLFLGLRRFEAFQPASPSPAPSCVTVSTIWLRTVLLIRRAYQDNPARHEYLLTAAGKSLQGVMLMLADWENQQAIGEGAPLVPTSTRSAGINSRR